MRGRDVPPRGLGMREDIIRRFFEARGYTFTTVDGSRPNDLGQGYRPMNERPIVVHSVLDGQVIACSSSTRTGKSAEIRFRNR